MTTITVVAGNKSSGKAKICLALTNLLRDNGYKAAYFNKRDVTNKQHGFLNDIILLSDSNDIEPWMKPWFDMFGEPLFIIRSERTRAKS